jgi:hypothetical protein
VAHRLDQAVRAYRDAQAAAAASEQRAADDRAEVLRKRDALIEAIVAAAEAGMRQVDIIKITGYSRERVRQILRAGGVGVEPD